jgi:carbon storage regulator CsrA
MLVLSRRPTEKVLLPDLGVTFQVLSTRGNTVRLGIDAPPQVKILREEIDAVSTPQAAAAPPSVQMPHRFRNHLNKLGLALQLFERQWQAGLTERAQATFQQALEAIETLDREWEAAHAPSTKTVTVPCRTLVVEDDSNERELLAGLLGMNGCECATAADGLDALDYLARHQRPDFVLLDMGLPRCDGAQTVTQIRRDPRYTGIKVFAISGSRPEDYGIAIGPAGVDAWFCKPLKPRSLWQTIQQHLTSTSAAN